MAKKNIWAIDLITEERNKVNGGTMYKLRFRNVFTGEQLNSYADPNNRNYLYWTDYIVNRGQAQVVTGIEVINRNGKRVIDADKRAELLWRGSREELLTETQRLQQKKNNFNDLFDE